MGSQRAVYVAWALAVLALTACAGDDSAAESGGDETAYFDCLRERGLSEEDIALLNPETDGDPEHIVKLEDEPRLLDLLTIDADCITESGIGETANSPENIAASTESALAMTECMRELGWHDFPDPEPGVFGGLVPPSRIEPPGDAEERSRFDQDLNQCSIEALGVPVEGLDPDSDDHDHDH